MKTALIVIDIQNDYFPGGAMELKGSIEASLQARRLLDYFRSTSQEIIIVQHLATRPGATFFIPGTPGVEIHPNVAPREHEQVIQKNYPNSFRETRLLEHIRSKQIERLVICGMMTHMCVDAGARAAADLGFQNLIAGDACATRDLSFDGKTIPAEHVQGAFLAALNGSYGKVMGTDALIDFLRILTNET
jgi:nicotinamidase-related amidase